MIIVVHIVFEITDPNNKNLKIVKFGRTQHKDALKRYPTKARYLNIFQLKLFMEKPSVFLLTNI
jgi:hypothetical protein